jgi:hypothetical protein
MCHPDKKINKETSELNNSVDQIDLIEIYRIFYPAAAKLQSTKLFQNRSYFST